MRELYENIGAQKYQVAWNLYMQKQKDYLIRTATLSTYYAYHSTKWSANQTKMQSECVFRTSGVMVNYHFTKDRLESATVVWNNE